MRRLVHAILLCGLVTSASPAVAAPPSSSVREALPKDVQPQFDEASRLYKQSRFAEARDLFLATHAKSGEPRVLFNVAVCDKALGRYARAIATLKRSLATTERSLPADYTAKVAEAIATLSRFVAFVTVETSVDGATVTVDGEPLRENPLALETGEHSVVASKDGYEPSTTTVAVRAGESQQVKLTLEPSTRPGTATITCAGVTRCEIRMGDEVLGQAPVSLSRSAGSYWVRAIVDGREWSKQQVELQNGRAVAITLVGSAARVARLRVNTGRTDDTIEVDGAPGGRSGVELQLAPGEHRIVIARKDGASRTLDLLLREDETRELRVMLDEKKGISPWWFVGSGVVVAGAIAVITVIALQPTRFEGNTAGTLNPFVVPASIGGPER